MCVPPILMATRAVMLSMAVAPQIRADARAWGEARSARFREQAEVHRVRAWYSQDYKGGCLYRYTALSTHHEAMREKYLRAERRPWLPVLPDPPAPPMPECARPPAEGSVPPRSARAPVRLSERGLGARGSRPIR